MNRHFIVSIFVSLLVILAVRLLDFRLDMFPHLEDKGASWYYWKLPDLTLWGTITAWGGYLLHQVTVFWFILKRKNTDRFLLLNLFFVVLHIVQTHLFYDGLAQYVPVWSSQYSVILMLSITLVLLIPRRGFILGRFRKISQDVYRPFRKFHGLYISWALVYTFWFHPMEGDTAILLGFLYMFFLFIHMSMFQEKIHQNIKWITFLESFVVIHGVGIALMNGQEIWPMFLTGFLFMFFFTYMYGLGLKRYLRHILLVVYLGIVVYLYYQRGFNKLYEVTFIPVTLYGISLLMMGLSKLYQRVVKR